MGSGLQCAGLLTPALTCPVLPCLEVEFAFAGDVMMLVSLWEIPVVQAPTYELQVF